MFRTFAFGLAFSLAYPAAFAADAPASNVLPVKAFFSYPKLSDLKISPDGKYLALAMSTDPNGFDSNELVILGADDLKLKAQFTVTTHVADQSILDYWWANDERVLIATKRLLPDADRPQADGQLFAINADGSKERLLLGPGSWVFFWQLISRIPDDPRHVVVRAVPGYLSAELKHRESHAYQVDVYDGTVTQLKMPFEDAEMLADENGVLRATEKDDKDTGKPMLALRPDPAKDDWVELDKLLENDDPASPEVGPAGVMPDGHTFYWWGRTPSSTVGLFSLDPTSLKQEPLFGDPDFDVSEVIWSFDFAKDRHIIAVETDPGLPALDILDGNDPKAKYLAEFYGIFPDHRVSITSNTRDQSKMVLFIRSDKDPGEYYLYDAKANTMKLLFKSKPEIDPSLMGTTQPIEFKARDGLTIHGYLTTPPGVDAKNLPLILSVHGGPHEVYTTWGWDREVQFFANHGYAVLELNYRGSGGYGMKFQDAGYLHWGTTMQDDLADGVRWVEQQGYVDPKRVCIYGGSYGGYAALENAIRYPDLYQCTVGYAGVYDLTLMGHSGVYAQRADARNDFDVYLGKDMDERKRQSPVYNADKLTIPALIIYGGADPIAVAHNSEEMLAAMDKAGVKHPPAIVMPNEMHGFVNPDNIYPMYTKMLAFFDQYIGSDAAKGAAATK